MPDYKALYYNFFNSVTDAIEQLKQSQQQAEQQYLEDKPTVLQLVVQDNADDTP